MCLGLTEPCLQRNYVDPSFSFLSGRLIAANPLAFWMAISSFPHFMEYINNATNTVTDHFLWHFLWESWECDSTTCVWVGSDARNGYKHSCFLDFQKLIFFSWSPYFEFTTASTWSLGHTDKFQVKPSSRAGILKHGLWITSPSLGLWLLH